MTKPDGPLSSICVQSDASIGEALTRLEQGHRRIVLVVDDDGRLLGVATDSDFRRAMLARVDFDRPVASIMTKRPIAAGLDMAEADMLALMRRTHCHELPVIDRDGRVRELLLIEDLLARTVSARGGTAVVMAGGLGERLRPLTESTPKPLLPVGDRPILFTLLDGLLADRFERVYVTVNYLADVIEAAVAEVPRYRDAVRFVRETERLGTAGALSLLPERPDRPFLVANADLLTKLPFQEMMRFHAREGNALTVALREERFMLPYGIATLEGTRVTAMIEKPTLTHFVNAGVYVMDPGVLDRIRPGAPMDATTLIGELIGAEARVGSFPVREYWIDIGQPHQLEQARRDYQAVFADGAVNHPREA